MPRNIRSTPSHLFAIALLAATAAAPRAQGHTLVERNSPLRVVEPDANDRALRTTPVVKAVQRARDSVVSIYLQHQLARRNAVTEGQGSGVLLDDSGLVITNWHVIAPVLLGERVGETYGVEVKLRDGRQRSARVLTSSPTRDLALLQLELRDGERVQPIEIGRSGDLMIGETVIAIGNPQGHANTVTSGVLSATDRSIQVRAPDGVIRRYTGLLQTDAAINQGNSGGALLDITGRLIGINNAMAAGAENIGFAIPMDIVRQEFQRELLQSTSFVASGSAPWLGLEVADRDGRVVVREVVPGGPAELVGVRVGDVLRRIAGHDVRTSIDYLRHFLDATADAHIRLTLEREGRRLAVETQPLTRSAGAVLAGIGVRLREISIAEDRDLVRAATLAFYRGSGRRSVPLFPSVLLCSEVAPNSPAAVTGLEAGDVLLGVVLPGRWGDREIPLHTALELARLVQDSPGKGIKFIILRGDRDLVGTVVVNGRPRDGR